MVLILGFHSITHNTSLSSFIMPFHSIPFHTRVSHGATNGATHMLARDNARAQRLLAGLHAHGPIALHARKQRGSGSPSGHAQPVHHEGSQPAPQNSIHVNDAGSLVEFSMLTCACFMPSHMFLQVLPIRCLWRLDNPLPLINF